MRHQAAWVVALALWSTGCVGVSAARLMQVKVDKIGSNSFSIVIETDIKAPQATTWGVLTDYDQQATFLPYLVKSQVVYRNAEYKVVDQEGRFHMLFWTFGIQVKQKVREERPDAMQFQAIDGDFTQMDGQWKLSPDGNNTHLFCEFKVQPRRRVPGWAVQMVAKRYLSMMVDRIGVRAETGK